MSLRSADDGVRVYDKCYISMTNYIDSSSNDAKPFRKAYRVA